MPPTGTKLTGESVIDISHESLMRLWKRLDRWADEEVQSARIYLRLAEAANSQAFDVRLPHLHVVRHGSRAARAAVVAVGPMLDPTLAATQGLDVTVAYAATVRPFDAQGLRALPGSDTVVLVEPYLAGTSVGAVNDALADRPHRVLGLGVGRAELGHYGEAAEHDRAHGLDPAGIRRSIAAFVG